MLLRPLLLLGPSKIKWKPAIMSNTTLGDTLVIQYNEGLD